MDLGIHRGPGNSPLRRPRDDCNNDIKKFFGASYKVYITKMYYNYCKNCKAVFSKIFTRAELFFYRHCFRRTPISVTDKSKTAFRVRFGTVASLARLALDPSLWQLPRLTSPTPTKHRRKNHWVVVFILYPRLNADMNIHIL